MNYKVKISIFFVAVAAILAVGFFVKKSEIFFQQKVLTITNISENSEVKDSNPVEVEKVENNVEKT
jgi:tryptophanyl-tRNA synthetase